MWQDLVFLGGSTLSVLFLYPTLRDAASRVPRATSVPSMLIGGVYALTFFTLGMQLSAFGSFAACTMWSLIAMFRAPPNESFLPTTVSVPTGEDIQHWLRRRSGHGTPTRTYRPLPRPERFDEDLTATPDH